MKEITLKEFEDIIKWLYERPAQAYPKQQYSAYALLACDDNLFKIMYNSDIEVIGGLDALDKFKERAKKLGLKSLM